MPSNLFFQPEARILHVTVVALLVFYYATSYAGSALRPVWLSIGIRLCKWMPSLTAFFSCVDRGRTISAQGVYGMWNYFHVDRVSTVASFAQMVYGQISVPVGWNRLYQPCVHKAMDSVNTPSPSHMSIAVGTCRCCPQPTWRTVPLNMSVHLKLGKYSLNLDRGWIGYSKIFLIHGRSFLSSLVEPFRLCQAI